MTPKEKAEELYNKFLQYTPVEFEHEYTVKCALIAVVFASEFITGDLDESFDKALYLAEIKEQIELL